MEEPSIVQDEKLYLKSTSSYSACFLYKLLLSQFFFQRIPLSILVRANLKKKRKRKICSQPRYILNEILLARHKMMLVQYSLYSPCPVGWGCKIHRLHLCRGGKTPPKECPGYDTKQTDGEVPAVLELWRMRSTPLLPLLPGPLWPGVVPTDRDLSLG